MKSRLLPILITGFVLALGLLLAVQVTHSLQGGRIDATADAITSAPDFNQTVTPVIFQSISEQAGQLRLSGESEPDVVIVVQNNGQNFRQIKADSSGNWTTVLNVEDDPVMIIDLLVFVENGAKIRSDETLIRIPAPKTYHTADTDADGVSVETPAPALIMITAPGGPTRIVQSPFQGLPTAGPLSMGSIDYDESGSVIFSGMSEVSGQVRIYANDVLVGERPVEKNGRWYFIAAETLPMGSYEIKAELLTEPGVVSVVAVPFERLRKDPAPDSGAEASLRVNYVPYRWQVSRAIYGGGRQYTAVFAPQPTREDKAEGKSAN